MTEKSLPIGRPGTILFAMYASVGVVAELGTEATWNQALLGIEPKEAVANAGFLRYWLEHLRPELAHLARSNTQSNLNAEQVGNLPFPGRTLQLQELIADFLDAETARIDALIAKKQRLGELVEERWEQFVRSTLQGLDVPVLPLKRRWQVLDCKHRTPTYTDSGYPIVSPGDATPGRLDLNRCSRFVDDSDFRDLTSGGRQPIRGTIIYSRNASIGIACYVDTDQELTMGQDVCLIKSADEDQLYLTYALNTLGVDQLEEQKIGSTFSRVNVSQIVELKIPVPPREVQENIAREFDKERERVDRLTATLEKQTGLLREHRQALITAAVTGELEVPGVAT